MRENREHQARVRDGGIICIISLISIPIWFLLASYNQNENFAKNLLNGMYVYQDSWFCQIEEVSSTKGKYKNGEYKEMISENLIFTSPPRFETCSLNIGVQAKDLTIISILVLVYGMLILLGFLNPPSKRA